MAFTVNLYSFSKRENSTARPSGVARSFSCVVKTSTGILRPTIELDLGLAESPAQYNYAYIPQFNRYYFIEEWSFGTRLWEAQLSVDVLATYKTEIGASSLYVLRAAAEYDGRIVDNLYPTKTECDYHTNTLSQIWTNTNNGLYILGIVNKSPSFGSLNYYAMNRSALQTLLTKMLETIVTAGNDFKIEDASWSLQLALVDPLQYIKSAIFLPVADAGGIPIPDGLIPVYNWRVDVGDPDDVKNIRIPQLEYNYTIPIEKHPQTAARGNYVNVAPYTNITLSFPPFGVIELDTTVLCDVENINITVRLDIPTGLGIMEIFANGILLNKLETQIGVPIQLSQVTRDFGSAAGIIGATAGAVGMSGGAMKPLWDAIDYISGGRIGGKMSGIGSAVQSMGLRSNSMGSGGSYAQLMEAPRLDFQFFECVDDDITQNGRPLCQIKQINTLSGYMLIQDGDVPTTGTAEENRSIRAYLEGGFYYE